MAYAIFLSNARTLAFKDNANDVARLIRGMHGNDLTETQFPLSADDVTRFLKYIQKSVNIELLAHRINSGEPCELLKCHGCRER